MAVTGVAAPRFNKGQAVSFLGGSGTIKNRQLESGYWVYFVEMQMGPEPEVGRIGQETTVVLTEADLATSSHFSLPVLACC